MYSAISDGLKGKKNLTPVAPECQTRSFPFEKGEEMYIEDWNEVFSN